MTPEYIKRGNEIIAAFLGWFKEDGQPETWFVLTEHAKHVAYSEYNDPLRELNFHKSWDALMPVYQKISRLPSIGDIKFPISGPLGVYTNIKYNIPDREKTYFAIVEFLKYYYDDEHVKRGKR